ncbi:inner membrane transport permease YbhR [Peptococcaceae bacterium CEB3]|nr:inner membrane transport permease YbhR [Peptococcaceae bacterium CEB3]
MNFPMIWALVKKDLAIWSRSVATIVVTIVPALVLLLVLVLGAAAVSGNPVAIVNEDSGGMAAHKFVQMAQAYSGFNGAAVMTAQEATLNYEKLRVAAILTIPADFSAALANGRRPVIEWQVRNFNDDVANDLRRALPDIVDEFVKSGAAGVNPIHINVEEHDLHGTDAGFVAFNLVSILVVLILQSGIVNAGLASVREWESKTVKELLMSPASSLTLIAGKVLAGVITSNAASCIALAFAYLLGVITNVSWPLLGLSLLMMTLIGVFGSGVGLLLAAVLRKTERVSAVSIIAAFYLFFLAGGLADVAYLPPWLQALARFIPNTYAVSALRDTLLYNSTVGLGKDFVVLGLSSLLALALGVPMLRRGLEN